MKTHTHKHSFRGSFTACFTAVRVGFEATSYNASEEEGSVTFCLLLENNQILGTDVATVMVLTTGSATGKYLQ